MVTTTYVDGTFGVREIGSRTDSSGTSVDDLPLEQDAMVNAILTEGYLTDGAFEVAADSPASMDVIVGSGTAKADIYVVETDETGRHPYWVRLDDANVTVTLDAADASNPRIDEIWLVVRDPALSGDAGSLALPRIAYRKGDADASPSAPGADSAWAASVKLATITVSAGATSIAAGDIADNRAATKFAAQIASDRFAEVAGDTFTGGVTFEDGMDARLASDTFGPSDGPSSWPEGMSWQIVNSGAWPESLGTVFTWHTTGATARDVQIFVDTSSTPVMYLRSGSSSTTWSGWQTLTTAENPSLWEVDNSTEVSSYTADIGMETGASVSLTIPSDWGSWKCQAYATFTCGDNGSTPSSLASQIVIDGTAQQSSDIHIPGDIDDQGGAIGGRRTGMSTTGSRTVAVQFGSANGAVVRDIFLYARAVRTS